MGSFFIYSPRQRTRTKKEVLGGKIVSSYRRTWCFPAEGKGIPRENHVKWRGHNVALRHKGCPLGSERTAIRCRRMKGSDTTGSSAQRGVLAQRGAFFRSVLPRQLFDGSDGFKRAVYAACPPKLVSGGESPCEGEKYTAIRNLTACRVIF